MTVVYIILSLTVILTILSCVAARKFADTLVHPVVRTYEEARNRVLECCEIDPYSALEGHKTEPFTYRSEFGYDLQGKIIRANETREDGKERAVILSHGWRSNHVTMLTYGKLYQKLGFSVVVFDHRYHGNSDRNVHCTMGLYESRDLVGLASYVRRFFPENTIWGIHGESMGAATAMQAAPDIPWLSFLVEDCGYSSLRGQMKATLDSMHLPHFPILNMGSAILKKRYGLDMDKVNASQSVKNINIPMLFCQGDSDTFVPTKMIYDVYNAKKDKKKMQLFKGSKHAESVWNHTAQYAKVLEDFLKEYGII